ncbi:hypothetical protein Lepto7375DRAFT_0975 [Leptolyngbya sp. PCC 7375]|nr:hypothetical protein Lepto7375DRAFT_0975 [Leptolyngbya sp. PCC 7375]
MEPEHVYSQDIYGFLDKDLMSRLPYSNGKTPPMPLLCIAIALETGRTPSDVVKEAIGLYLEKTDPDSVAVMTRRLSALKKQVRKLLQIV